MLLQSSLWALLHTYLYVLMPTQNLLSVTCVSLAHDTFQDFANFLELLQTPTCLRVCLIKVSSTYRRLVPPTHEPLSPSMK